MKKGLRGEPSSRQVKRKEKSEIQSSPEVC